ncbi:RNA dependent RNA polymerase-domain-containing protein [Copromyces sp. CBS 386.78]|nr:RNA dependent RNA polymerase-domain-containing protein [Copromyces sp. CBS 386.78]
MEVFISNLPRDLSERSLKSHLKPVMDKLHIRHYDCDKRSNKPHGKIIFVTQREAMSFLGTHSRLRIMNQQAYCKVSHPQPRDIQNLVNGIRHEAEEQERLKKEIEENATNKTQPTRTATSALDAGVLDCGHWSYINGNLTFITEWSSTLRVSAKFAKHDLRITCSAGSQVCIPYRSIQELVWSNDGHVAVTLTYAPTFLSPPILSDRPGQPMRMRLEACDSNHAKVSKFCLVYHFKVSGKHLIPNQGHHLGTDFRSAINGLNEQEIFWVTLYKFPIYSASPQDSYPVAVERLRRALTEYEGQKRLPYGLLFNLQALVYRSYLHPTTVLELAKRLADMFEMTRRSGQRQDPISVDAFKDLFKTIDWPSPSLSGSEELAQFEVDGIIEHLKETEKRMREGYAMRPNDEIPSGLTKIYRVLVTPTRIELHGPELEAKNRILRKFPDDQDYFLRVQFGEEDGQDLFFNSTVSMDTIYQRFKDVLTNGILVGGRVYRFLGFSHSSLRAHSLWLSAPFFLNGDLKIAETIIEDLGDFRNIKSPARRAARIGQAFSETPYSISLNDHDIEVVRHKDVQRNGRVFSDGVGKISQGALEAIHREIPESKGYPNCFQVRWAGAKGMLALDTRLTGRQICIRDSMEKFRSHDQKHLEICDMASKPIPLMLNRQMIKILEDMGAPAEWFIRLQEKELQHLRAITDSVHNVAAFLKLQCVGDSVHLSQFLKDVHKMNIDYRKDQFLRGIVEAVVLRELRLLKHKARIPVPHGITLFGVMDETGLLREGEVYVTYETLDGRFKDPPAAGPVVVTRSPALHPGDIQVARNVIPPAGSPLRELKNCIVFSQNGGRDLPSQLSGGDLDGDTFNVIWDQRIVSKLQTFSAADYPRVQPLELDREIESKDMADFFVEFMKADHLGVIAVRHMILADVRDKGTLDEDCLTLAALHSKAVDFSKSGIHVNINELPRPPPYRPDFLVNGPDIKIHDKSQIDMEEQYLRQDSDDEDDRPRYKYYASEKILGQLFRAVDEKKIWTKHIKLGVPPGGPSFWKELETCLLKRIRPIGQVRWQHRLDEARRICQSYEDAIRDAMVEFADSPTQPLKELEVVMGFILNKKGIQSRRQRDKSSKLPDAFARIAKMVTNALRPSSPPEEATSELYSLELCLACFYVAFDKKSRPQEPWKRQVATELESFRLVASSTLLLEIMEQEKRMRLRHAARAGGFVGVRGGSRVAGRGGRGGHHQPIRVDVNTAAHATTQQNAFTGGPLFDSGSPSSTSAPMTPSSGSNYTSSSGPFTQDAISNGSSGLFQGYQQELGHAQTAAGTAGASGGGRPSNAAPATMPVKLTPAELIAQFAAQLSQMQIHQMK